MDHYGIEFSVTTDAKIVSIVIFCYTALETYCGVDEIVMYNVIKLEITFILRSSVDIAQT